MPRKNNLILHTYTRDAVTVNALKDLLDCRRIFRDTREVANIPAPCLIVNFGSSQLNPRIGALNGNNQILLNRPEKVAICTSKVLSYNAFVRNHVPTPMISQNRAVARQWLREDGIVLMREDGRMAGEGITVIRQDGDFGAADGDFYSRYRDKTHEFRIHVWKGTVIDVIEKRRRPDWHAGNQDGNPEIRNHRNGYLFYRNQVALTQQQRDILGRVAVQAVEALELDFGAVDMLARMERHNGGPELDLIGYSVCEVNSSPALDGDDAKRPYVTAILREWQRVTNGVAAQEAGQVPGNGNAWAA